VKFHEATLAEVERAEAAGLISHREARRFWLAWLWSAPRFGGDAAMRQDIYGATHGYEALIRRRERIRRAARKVWNGKDGVE
jgi:hypothetical protein